MTTLLDVRTLPLTGERADDFFDREADAIVEATVPNPHPALVRMAVSFTHALARRCALAAGEPPPKRGEFGTEYMSVFRGHLCRLHLAAQQASMQAATRPPVVYAN